MCHSSASRRNNVILYAPFIALWMNPHDVTLQTNTSLLDVNPGDKCLRWFTRLIGDVDDRMWMFHDGNVLGSLHGRLVRHSWTYLKFAHDVLDSTSRAAGDSYVEECM